MIYYKSDVDYKLLLESMISSEKYNLFDAKYVLCDYLSDYLIAVTNKSYWNGNEVLYNIYIIFLFLSKEALNTVKVQGSFLPITRTTYKDKLYIHSEWIVGDWKDGNRTRLSLLISDEELILSKAEVFNPYNDYERLSGTTTDELIEMSSLISRFINLILLDEN